MGTMKHSTVLNGVAHDTGVSIIAPPPPPVIGILVPLVAMSTKRSRAANWKMEAEVEKAMDFLDRNFWFLWEVVA